MVIYTARGIMPGSNLIDLRVVYVGLVFLAAAVYGYDRLTCVSASNPTSRNRVSIYVMSVLALTAYGVVTSSFLISTAMDAAGYLIVLCFLILGRHDRFWIDLEKPLIVLFWISFGLTIVGLRYLDFDLQELHAQFGLEFEGATETLGYRISGLLALYPILFVLAISKPKFDIWSLLGVATLVASLGLQVYFTKRAPVARAVTYLVFALSVLPMLRGKSVSIWRLGIVAVLAAGVFVSVDRYLPGLIAKFRMEDESRFDEALALISDLSPLEWVFGRGMGGTFTPPRNWVAGILNEGGVTVRDTVHIGILHPVLKGGLAFAYVYYANFYAALRKRSTDWFRVRFNLVALTVIPVYVLFQFIEGPPSISNVFDAVLVGLVCGRGVDVVLSTHSKHVA